MKPNLYENAQSFTYRIEPAYNHKYVETFVYFLTSFSIAPIRVQ